ncbi:MAG: NAD(P)H-hydrate dehydratase [Planctomycetota bacterium]
MPARPSDGHKGTFGTVVVIGGCAASRSTMLGAPVLAARAALRSGAGLAKLVLPEPLIESALLSLPSATARGLPVEAETGAHNAAAAAPIIDEVVGDADAVTVGPGLGAVADADRVVMRTLMQDDVPIVLDADGLNAMASLPDFASDVRAPLVITPHPGEFARLARALGVQPKPQTADERAEAAGDLARRLGCVVVLKGAGTVVTDGQRAWTCARSVPALATAGTGDVLAGLIAGLIAQAVAPHRPELAALPEAIRAKMPKDEHRPLTIYDAARVAVEAHALTGERWATVHEASGGLLAEELADELPTVLDRMRTK